MIGTDTTSATFYNGDCLVEMDKIADKSIDMILCDLPYGTTACKWDVVIPFEPLWEQYERIIKDNGAIVLTASQPFTSALVMSNPKIFKYEWIWEKNKGSNFATVKYMPFKQHESVLIFYKSLPVYNPIRIKRSEKSLKRDPAGTTRIKRLNKTKNEAYEINGELRRIDTAVNLDGLRPPKTVLQIGRGPVINKEFKHPTQKPVLLMEYFIKTYTNEGDTVLDNCMGSGTTGVACKNLNRHFIGIEKDEKYFELAVNRINKTQPCFTLFP